MADIETVSMRGVRRGLLLVTITATVGAVAPQASGATPIPGASACPVFPTDSFWHADVSALPVNPKSAAWVASIGTTATLKADFGSGLWNGGPIGIPYTTVAGTQTPVPVSFTYADESDGGPYPVPPAAPIEGGPASTGDRHVLVVDRDRCRLWELYNAYPQNGGSSWTAGSGATWDLSSDSMRPLGWTSGDAAGLAILPGLVRYDEVAAGEIDHVIRFTAPRTANGYVWPASHKAPSGGASDPPMGAWFRLKADFDVSGFSTQDQVILRALKKHGMVLADNGSPWFMSGAPDPGWDNNDLSRLRSIPGSAFEAVDVSSLEVSPASYATNGAASATATFTYPVDGQSNVDTTKAFRWTAAPGAQGYIVVVGSSVHGVDLANSGVLPPTSLSFATPAFPTGKALHATLLTEHNNTWSNFSEVSFTAAPGLATFTSPLNGQLDVDTTNGFSWSTIPASQGSILVVGTTAFGTDLVNSGILPPSQSAFAMPALPGGILYANLLTKVNGAFTRYQQIAFSAASGGAHFTNPLDGQSNVDTTKAFTWLPVPGAQGYILVVGSADFGTDLANSGVLPPAASSFIVTGLPPGATMHATLLTEVRGAWVNYQAIGFTSGH